MTDKLNVVLHVHPRTASTSLLQYLQVNEPENAGNIHHCHYLVNRRHKWSSRSKSKKITRLGKGEYKVITAVRDPVAINLSVFWAWEAKHVTRQDQIYYGEAKRFFMRTIDHQSPIHHTAAEIEAFWDLDFWTHPMHDEPWRIYKDKLLVLKFEKIETWPEAIEEFLGIPQAKFPRSNPSKWVLQFNFSDAYLRSLYRSHHCTFFYSQDEINAFVRRYGGTEFERIDGKKHITMLGEKQAGQLFSPVRIIEDESELPEDDTAVKARAKIFRDGMDN